MLITEFRFNNRYNLCYDNSSLWYCDAKLWHNSASTLANKMVCFLTAPSHYLNSCWFFINGVLWQLPNSNIPANAQDFNMWNEFENNIFKITITFPRGNELFGLSHASFDLQIVLITCWNIEPTFHYGGVMISAMTFQNTGVSVVYSHPAVVVSSCGEFSWQLAFTSF